MCDAKLGFGNPCQNGRCHVGTPLGTTLTSPKITPKQEYQTQSISKQAPSCIRPRLFRPTARVSAVELRRHGRLCAAATAGIVVFFI